MSSNVLRRVHYYDDLRKIPAGLREDFDVIIVDEADFYIYSEPELFM